MTAPAAATPHTARRPARHALGWALAGAVSVNAGAIFLAAFGAAIERDLGLSHTLLGTLQTGFFVGNAGGSILFSLLLRARGLRATALAALAAGVAGNLLSAVPHFWPLALGRTCLGAAACGMGLCAGSVIVHAFPHRQHALLNLLHACFIGGSGIGMLVTVPLATHLGGLWRAPLAFAGLLLLPLTAFALGPAPAAAASPTPGLHALLQTARRPALYRAGAVIGGYILAETAFILFFPIYLEQSGRTKAAAAASVAVLLAGLGLGRLLIAGSGGPAGGVRTTACLVATSGVGLGLAALSGLRGGATWLLLLAGLLAGPTAPLAISLAVRHAEEHRNEMLALTNLTLCLSGLVGGVLAGAWCDGFGVQASLLLCAALYTVSFLPLLGLRRPPATATP